MLRNVKRKRVFAGRIGMTGCMTGSRGSVSDSQWTAAGSHSNAWKADPRVRGGPACAGAVIPAHAGIQIDGA